MPWGMPGPRWRGGMNPPLRGWKYLIVGLLARESLAAKDIVARLSAVSYGIWAPTAPAIYMALKDLEASGIVRKVGDKYELTEQGKELVEYFYPIFPLAFYDPIEVLKRVVEELEKRKLTEEEKKLVKELAEKLIKIS